MAEFEVERALGLLCRPPGQLVHLPVQGGGLLLQPQVQLGGGELVAQEVQDLGRVLDLPLLVVQLTQGLSRRR